MAIRVLSALVLAAGLAGCASIDPDTGVQDAAPALPNVPQTTGFDTPQSAEQKRLTAQFGGAYRAPAMEAYLNTVLAKLAAADETAGQTYRVTILNTPAVNAFALPSGDLFLTRGLLALANDTSEVAAVMAHEIAHVSARHAAQRAEREKTEALKSRVATVIQSRARGEELMATGRVSLAGFSRQQELEADRIGVRSIAKAGYDPYGASRFLVSLGRSTQLRAQLLGGQARDDMPDIMSTHPSTPDRVAQATASARQIGAPGVGAIAREPYLAAVDGLNYGDDPAEGVVRGRRFIHPKLGFGFTAPEHFALENSAKALLGIADGGGGALRLDSVSLPMSTTLETYLTTGWIEGLQASTIQSRTVNGLPAAVATAKSADWSFRVAAIRLGNDVYRLIFATRALSDAEDQRFMDSIDTFRRLTAEEVGRVRPLKIALATAGGRDTIDSMASKMAGLDRPVDTFLVLNGLERAASLTAGRAYKIVVE
jgi:predicted Zn-dependent protease